MTDTSIDMSPLDAAIEAQNWDRVEELWLEALDKSPTATATLLEIRRQLWKAGKKALAMTLLELLTESLETVEDHKGALAALREQVRLTTKPGAKLRERFERAFASSRAGSPSLEAVMERYRLAESRRPAEVLEKMECWLNHDRGTVVEVIGQGVGRVADINLELENVKVDLGGARPVSVPFGAVSRFLRILPEGDWQVICPTPLRYHCLYKI